eukprot:442148-Prymnesium_polylepis.1
MWYSEARATATLGCRTRSIHPNYSAVGPKEPPTAAPRETATRTTQPLGVRLPQPQPHRRPDACTALTLRAWWRATWCSHLRLSRSEHPSS